MTRPSRARALAGNALLALVSTVLLLGLLEGAAYLAGVTPRYEDQAYVGPTRMRNCQFKFHQAQGMCAHSDILRVIEVARREGAEVLLVTQVSNLYEFPIQKDAWDKPRPEPKAGTRTARWREHFRKGVTAFRAERFDEALAEFKQSRDINPGGRAPGQLNDVVRELGTGGDHVHLVDFERELDRIAVREGIGCNFFGHGDYCDQFHPNTRTNHLLAQALFRAIDDLKLPEGGGALGR